MSRLPAWLRALWPGPLPADRRERVRVVGGALLGIGVTAALCRLVLAEGWPGWPWLIAPMGASAVLVFAMPASPLAQPWPVIAGNTVSALVGIACARWIGPPELAAAVAVGGAIAVMMALRCLHPPGGAAALLAVLGGITDPAFALHPVLLNAALLAATGMVYNPLTRRAYPHRQLPPEARAAVDDEAAALDADLDAVLARYNQVLDISRDDLKALLQDTRLRAYQRKLSHLHCRDIMSKHPITVHGDTPLVAAWALFRRHRIKALPVVDAAGRVIGIVTPADFMRAAEVASEDGFELRQRKLREWAGAGAARDDVVARLMTREVSVAREDHHLAELIPLFGSTGHHHIPIVDAEGRLLGMVTESDVVAALARLQA